MSTLICTWWEIICRSKLARSREMRRLARSRDMREWRRKPSTSVTTNSSTTRSSTSSTHGGTASDSCEFAGGAPSEDV